MISGFLLVGIGNYIFITVCIVVGRYARICFDTINIRIWICSSASFSVRIFDSITVPFPVPIVYVNIKSAARKALPLDEVKSIAVINPKFSPSSSQVFIKWLLFVLSMRLASPVNFAWCLKPLSRKNFTQWSIHPLGWGVAPMILHTHGDDVLVYWRRVSGEKPSCVYKVLRFSSTFSQRTSNDLVSLWSSRVFISLLYSVVHENITVLSIGATQCMLRRQTLTFISVQNILSETRLFALWYNMWFEIFSA